VTSLHPSATTLAILAGEPLAATCTWLRGPGDVNSVAPSCPSRWAWAASGGDDRLVAHGGGFMTTPTNDTPSRWQLSFPCGIGPVAYTACADESDLFDASNLALVTVSFSSPLSSFPPETALEVNIDGTTMQLGRTDDGWSLTAPSAPSARVLLRGDAATFVVPADLLSTAPAYTVSLSDDSASVTQPPQPMLGAIIAVPDTSVPETTAPPATEPETPADLFEQLSTSIASGDLQFAIDRLHPFVIDAYGVDACRAELEGRVAPGYEITVEAVGEEAPWTWQLPDGRSFELPLATTVTVRIPGIEGAAEGHLVLVDDQFRWFTVCDGE
jgi:hypothetical protein